VVVLCDLGASVSTIPDTLFDKLGMGPTELRLHLADSTDRQVVGMKYNIVVKTKGRHDLIDLIIMDMPEDPIAPIFTITSKSARALHRITKYSNAPDNHRC
jgi:hypothetical protein